MKVNRAALEQLPAEQRERAEKILGELSTLREDNPLQFFKPHPKQSDFLDSHVRTKAFLGGNRSGKTVAGIVDDLIQAVDGQCIPDSLIHFKTKAPPFRCRIVAADFTQTMEGVIFEVLRSYAPRHQLKGGSWEKAYDKQLRTLRFENGSWFQFLTYEQDLDHFRGASLDRVHFDEEPPEDIRKECRMRLMDRSGQEVLTMTPEHGMSWCYDAIYERRDEEDIAVFEVATDENPHLSAQQIEDYFRGMTPQEIEAKRKGRFVSFQGKVLQGFDERHLVAAVEPEHIRDQFTLVVIDPGIVRAAVGWYAFDRDDTMLVFDELYPQDLDVPAIARLIKERNERWGEPDYYVLDPSGRNRSLTGSSVIEEFAIEGIYCSPGQNARDTSIRQLRRRVYAYPPALMVSRDCPNWIREANRWRVAEDEDSTKDKKEGDTFKTVGPDHLMDTARYAAMERIWGPSEEKTRHRWNTGGVPVASGRAPRFRPPRNTDAPPTGALT